MSTGKCKVSKIKPLFKKGYENRSQEYRPTAFLPLVFKNVEKSVHYQLHDYL